MANLSEDDLKVLEVSDRSNRKAAAVLGIPPSTYEGRLRQARSKAQRLAKTFS